jgi:hypothetical protein
MLYVVLLAASDVTAAVDELVTGSSGISSHDHAVLCCVVRPGYNDRQAEHRNPPTTITVTYVCLPPLPGLVSASPSAT